MPTERPDISAAAISFAGPDELSARLIAYRTNNAAVFNNVEGPALSDENIRRLVRLVYHISLIADEGRYPRFRLLFTSTSTVAGVQLASLPGGIPLERSFETLKRLIPTIDDPNTALLVHTGPDGLLMAWSIVDFTQFCDENSGKASDRLWDSPSLPSGMLFLRCDGPGDIRAMLYPGGVMHLRGGSIKTLKGYTKAVAPFNMLLARLGADTHTAFQSDPRAAHFLPSAYEYAVILARLWSAALSVAVRARHGGSYAIVGNPHDACLKVRFPAAASLFDSFSDSLRETFSPLAGGRADDTGVVRERWRTHEHRLLAVARLVGQLAATDGCVVLDQRLAVSGFGAKIAVPEHHAGAPLLDATSHGVVSDDEIGGMRHRSALALVRAQRGAIVFVVSQDADLTVFFSDENAAYRANHLHAASSISEFI